MLAVFSLIFVVDAKITCVYNFVAPLTNSLTYFFLKRILVLIEIQDDNRKLFLYPLQK